LGGYLALSRSGEGRGGKGWEERSVQNFTSSIRRRAAVHLRNLSIDPNEDEVRGRRD